MSKTKTARWDTVEELAFRHVFGPKKDTQFQVRAYRMYGKAATKAAVAEAKKMREILVPANPTK